MKVCRLCRENDGVSTSVIANSQLMHPVHKTTTLGYACARCLEAGRATRVTCKSFITEPSETRQLKRGGHRGGKSTESQDIASDQRSKIRPAGARSNGHLCPSGDHKLLL